MANIVDKRIFGKGSFEKYVATVDGELIALGAYEVLEISLVVYIVYVEAHPESSPTLCLLKLLDPQPDPHGKRSGRS